MINVYSKMSEVLPLLQKQINSTGFIHVVDVMPRLVLKDCPLKCDYSIVQAARVSYGAGTTKKSTDQNLIRYLFKNKHSTPFEMIQFKFHVSAPIFVVRQWQRHRTGTFNELSGRYSMMGDTFWKPGSFRKQSITNKQGSSDEPMEETINNELLEEYSDHIEKSYLFYKKMIDQGVSRELARTVLPLSVNTQFYWSTNLHNLLHFTKLRSDPHAQEEIRVYAKAIEEILDEYCPITMESYRLEQNLHR
jgi:thymidylate synthase (FAD)